MVSPIDIDIDGCIDRSVERSVDRREKEKGAAVATCAHSRVRVVWRDEDEEEGDA